MIDQAQFIREFRDLCERHGIVDFAIIAHGIQGGEALDWAAGTGDAENTIGDRDRAAKLYFNLSGMTADVLAKTWMPPAPQPDLSPIEE